MNNDTILNSIDKIKKNRENKKVKKWRDKKEDGRIPNEVVQNLKVKLNRHRKKYIENYV